MLTSLPLSNSSLVIPGFFTYLASAKTNFVSQISGKHEQQRFQRN